MSKVNTNNPRYTTMVESLGSGIVKIRKIHTDSGAETSALIVNTGIYVFIVTKSTRVREETHVSYLQMFDLESDAYQKWIHLIGKLVLKDIYSKYFDSPIYEEHLLNGNNVDLTERDRQIVAAFAKQYQEAYQ